MILAFIVIIAFYPVYGESLPTTCSDFSHERILEIVNTRVEYKQIQCQSFHKTFYDLTTGEVILTEDVEFSPKWAVETVDHASQYYEKKFRLYWDQNQKYLIEDYVIDGHSKIAARLRRFYRVKSMIYALNDDAINISGQDFHRYEFGDGSIEIKNDPISLKYTKL